MKLLAHIFCLALALALAQSDEPQASAELDRCQGLEMDAVTLNEDGVPYFFKGGYVFKGFAGRAQRSNESFAELDDHHHVDHVDAAFHMHFDDDPSHEHMFFFLDEKVFSYHEYKLEEGYPKNIIEVFPDIPDHLDAAVECPKPECDEDTVIFFKGTDKFYFDMKTKAVVKKEFASMPQCTSAFRFMEHYYCFHGLKFSVFDPKTGEVAPTYPKDTRDFFVRCSSFGEESDNVERERCSRVHLDAITSDNAGNMYAFRGHYYLHKDAGNDTLMVDTIESAFRELQSEVDAVFSYEHQMYMIKDNDLYVYRDEEPHTLLDGFPKPVKDELGLEGPIDAAFICEDDQHIAHLIKGQNIYDVNMQASPRVASNERPVAAFKHIDGAMCGPTGLKVFVGNHYYTFPSVMLMVASRALPEQHKLSAEIFGCDH